MQVSYQDIRLYILFFLMEKWHMCFFYWSEKRHWWIDEIFGTCQTVLLVIILAFTHLVAIIRLLLIILPKKSHHHVLQFQGYGLRCDFYLLVPSLLHLFCFSLLSKLLNLLEFYCFLFSYSSMWLQNCTVIVACGGLQNKSLFTSETVYIASFLARF